LELVEALLLEFFQVGQLDELEDDISLYELEL
jgi:hypothetical protein